MLCPKCGIEQLVEQSLGSGIYRCSNCSSHWIDYKPVESYLAERDEMIAKAFRTIWDLNSEKCQNLKCPRDHTNLHLFSYKEIELDFCLQCKGLWFDTLEFEGFSNRDDIEKAKLRQAKREQEWHDLTAFGILEAAASVIGYIATAGLPGGKGN